MEYTQDCDDGKWWKRSKLLFDLMHISCKGILALESQYSNHQAPAIILFHIENCKFWDAWIVCKNQYQTVWSVKNGVIFSFRQSWNNSIGLLGFLFSGRVRKYFVWDNDHLFLAHILWNICGEWSPGIQKYTLMKFSNFLLII